MIKCPLCGWNNAESTQLCVSCGGDLERRTGLIREEGNPDCYSFTPARRIIDKGVGVTGSGNDLVFRFSSSGYVIPLIIAKILLFIALPYASIQLYLDNNTMFYVFIPLTILHAIDVLGWILFYDGGRKKKRKLMSFGMRFLYAFHAISMAYCILTVLITLYLSIAIGLSLNLGTVRSGVMGIASSRATAYFMAGAATVLLLVIIFLNVCAKFFYYTHDMFAKNSIKYYRFTSVISIGFIIMTVLSLVCTALMLFKEYVLEFISRYELLEMYLYSLIEESATFISIASGLLAIVCLISALMVFDYTKSYKKLFVSTTK